MISASPCRRSRLAALSLSTLALLSASGCVRSIDATRIRCTQDKYCPDGYVCVGAKGAEPGLCAKATDGGGIDGRPAADTGGAETATVSLVDTSGAIDVRLPAAVVDTALPRDADLDAPVTFDMGKDVATEALLGMDVPSDLPVSTPDQAIDIAAPPPDLGSEVRLLTLLGSPCALASECASNFCVDGVCCGAACTGQCQVCNSAGTCGRNSSGAPTGARASCSGSGSCVGTCDGSSDSCAYPSTTTTCGSATCSADLTTVITPACNGQGSCSSTTPSSCGLSSYCNAAGACATKILTGSSCASSPQCSSGNCSNYATTGARICCQSNYSNCGSCVDLQTSNSSCGSCGNACGPNRSCQTGSCGCNGYTFPSSCGSGCGTWSFESGTQESWVKDTDPSFPVNGGSSDCVANITISQSKVHDGSYALAVPANCNTGVASVAFQICSGSTINMAGYTMSAWVQLTGTALDAYAFLFFNAWGASGNVSSPVLTGDKIAVMDTWYFVQTTFANSVQADHVAIELSPGKSWTGTIYIDGITITPP